MMGVSTVGILSNAYPATEYLSGHDRRTSNVQKMEISPELNYDAGGREKRRSSCENVRSSLNEKRMLECRWIENGEENADCRKCQRRKKKKSLLQDSFPREIDRHFPKSVVSQLLLPILLLQSFFSLFLLNPADWRKRKNECRRPQKE